MGDNRDQVIERRPMDLAPAPVLKVEPPRNSPGSALLRTVPLPTQQTRYITTNIGLQSSGSSVPSSSSALIKQGNVQRLESVSSASSLGSTAVINRFNTQSLQTTSTSTYHVPRGAAAVANIAVPRSSLATPIMRGSSTLPTISVATSANQPGLMRAASPAVLAGGRAPPAWLGVASTQQQRHNNTFTQARGHLPVSSRVGVGSGTTVSTRPVLLQANPPHKPLNITHQPQQVHLTEKKLIQKGNVIPANVRPATFTSNVSSHGRVGSRLVAPPLRPVVLVSTPPPTVNTRPVLTSAVRVSSAPGVSKVYCQTATEPSVYIQTTHKTAQVSGGNMVSIANSLYSLPANSFYESSVSVPSNFHTFTTAPALTTTVTHPAPAPPQLQGLVTAGQPVRFPVTTLVVDPTLQPYVPSESAQTVQTTEPCNNTAPSVSTVQLKQNASPRPSILRKRDTEGTPGKAAKNLNPMFGMLSVSTHSSPPSPPKRPESRGNGGAGSSGGSTTISATSSPGLGTDSPPLKPEDERPVEMSPRKKPRKQQLTGNQMQEAKFSDDEMEFIQTEKIKKTPKEGVIQDGLVPKPVTKRPTMSLMRNYRPTWKAKHHHYLRYTDVKPREDKRPSVADIAAQKNVLQRVNGWKIYHLGAQMTDISNMETDVFDRLTAMLKVLEKKSGKDVDINRVNELIKGNIQRSKVITDQLQEAKCQVMKLFDHKCQVTEVLNRFSSRRSGKKRERV